MVDTVFVYSRSSHTHIDMHPKSEKFYRQTCDVKRTKPQN